MGANRTISQRELRNASGDVMRALDRGESFTVTRNGVPVGELTPVHPRRFVGKDTVLAALIDGTSIDPDRFRADVDRGLDQDPTPRG
jgi:prevent-host-death family protein